MASTSPKPKKGILKSSNSIDHSFGDSEDKSKKELEWDEMNILATHHPPDKDYGFMKVDEPPTPYNKAASSDDEEGSVERKGSVQGTSGLDPSDLASRLTSEGKEKRFGDESVDEDDESEEDDIDLTEEEKARKKAFMMKRKMHYNEFQAVQLAKKLMAEDKDDDDDEDENKGGGSSSGAKCCGESSSREQDKNNQGNTECLLSGQGDIV